VRSLYKIFSVGIGKRVQVQLVKLVAQKEAAGNWGTPAEAETIGVWAEISNPSGFRDYQNGQTQLGQTKRFLIRYRFDKHINCEWKIRYDDKDWTISEKQKIDEKRFYWRITATSKADV
jgi:SPP1 family predicted phage head-tail adaptor